MSEAAAPAALPPEASVRACEAVVIGASAGGVEALSELVRLLPETLHVPIFVVLHLSPSAPSVLPRILQRVGHLDSMHPESGQRAEPGWIYVAPPDLHLEVGPGGVMSVARGPKENGHRPAIDPLFRSAAETYAGALAGIVLTGTLDDGAAGAAAVHERGGVVIVQDPATALHPSMPLSVLAATPVDHVLDIPGIAGLVAELDRSTSEGGQPMSSYHANSGSETDEERISPFTCPECHGTLWETDEHGAVRFRCRVGHAYAPDALLASQEASLEAALWAAVRALEEKADLAEQIENRLSASRRGSSARRFAHQAREARRFSQIVRRVVHELDGTVPAPVEEADS